jgi:cell division septation protein DedD
MEQSTWKAQGFTLMVFAGIVILCSTFFVLGMLVGRTQALKIASAEAVEAAERTEGRPAPGQPELSFYDAIESKPAETPKTAPDPPASVINYQIGALSRASDAEKLLGELKEKGFRAFILTPAPADPNPLFRVQVGPFADEEEAELVRRQLEAEKYEPIVKK